MSEAVSWFALGISTGLLMLLPTLLLTRWLRRLLIRKHPAGAILSLYVGALLRTMAVLPGGLIGFIVLGGKNAGRFAILSLLVRNLVGLWDDLSGRDS